MHVAVLLVQAFVGTGITFPSLCACELFAGGIAMAGKNMGAEVEYDRKVDALWEEKRGLIMQIVGSIEGRGKLTAAHREHMTEIEEGLRKDVADLTNKYWTDMGN